MVLRSCNALGLVNELTTAMNEMLPFRMSPAQPSATTFARVGILDHLSEHGSASMRTKRLKNDSRCVEVGKSGNALEDPWTPVLTYQPFQDILHVVAHAILATVWATTEHCTGSIATFFSRLCHACLDF